MNKETQRGRGRLGFIFSVVILGIIIFLAVKIIPVRVTAYEFRDVLVEEARMGSVRNTDAVIAQRVMDAAADLEIPLDKKNLKVTRSKRKLTITAKYEQPIDLKVTTYVYRFNASETAPLW